MTLNQKRKGEAGLLTFEYDAMNAVMADRDEPVTREDSMGLYLYVLPPVDSEWEDFPVVSVPCLKAPNVHFDDVDVALKRENRPLWRALAIARAACWDGDFQQLPRVISLPDPERCDFYRLYMWKQNNNGATFLVSPVAIVEYAEYLDNRRF